MARREPGEGGGSAESAVQLRMFEAGVSGDQRRPLFSPVVHPENLLGLLKQHVIAGRSELRNTLKLNDNEFWALTCEKVKSLLKYWCLNTENSAELLRDEGGEDSFPVQNVKIFVSD